MASHRLVNHGGSFEYCSAVGLAWYRSSLSMSLKMASLSVIAPPLKCNSSMRRIFFHSGGRDCDLSTAFQPSNTA